MADLGQLTQKYQPVIDTINSFSEFGASVEGVDLAGEQLHLKASVPSKVIANRVWDSIKQVDPSYSDLKHEIATTGGDSQAYTIKSGDNLSKISKLFYGTANKYNEIAQANGIENPDRIQAGQQINVPALG
ncbi:LysM peptidoglycan-binding domain-containing protein [Edaphobacter albus]|uniref:LysM peptidoglycan-binding domain-containing protein n=1 Tax=Edaphobacter sp. 4G125 TaxID=2763071 RepID=UPI00164662D6|nr:LysM peptidoglycan-binding domain-containing protein [Edaphobacter sp. 4G125]QNI36473.1 LysM peptidoglycan-binding domain-containing protein [Edaphobacter sp. 4G125]